jgi:hypothetical protein
MVQRSEGSRSKYELMTGYSEIFVILDPPGKFQTNTFEQDTNKHNGVSQLLVNIVSYNSQHAGNLHRI